MLNPLVDACEHTARAAKSSTNRARRRWAPLLITRTMKAKNVFDLAVFRHVLGQQVRVSHEASSRRAAGQLALVDHFLHHLNRAEAATKRRVAMVRPFAESSRRAAELRSTVAQIRLDLEPPVRARDGRTEPAPADEDRLRPLVEQPPSRSRPGSRSHLAQPSDAGWL